MDLINAFLDRIKLEPTMIKPEEAMKLMEELRENNLKESTIQSYLTEVRKQINQHIDNDYIRTQLLSILRIPKIEQERLKTRAKNKEIKHIQTTKIDEFIENFLKKGTKTASFSEFTTFLLLTSGRRVYEIVKIGNFRIHKNTLLFSGSAKLKGKPDIEYEVPCLIDPKKFINLFRKYRKIFDSSQLSSREINAKYAMPLSRFVKKTFGNNITVHDLRRAYSSIAYEKFATKAKKQDFVRDILGHSEDPKNSTTYHYMNMELE